MGTIKIAGRLALDLELMIMHITTGYCDLGGIVQAHKHIYGG